MARNDEQFAGPPAAEERTRADGPTPPPAEPQTDGDRTRHDGPGAKPAEPKAPSGGDLATDDTKLSGPRVPSGGDLATDDTKLPDSKAPTDQDRATDDTVLPEIAARVHATLFGDAAPAALRMGRFVLLESLGEGGMGAVHAAYDEDLDRKVAIKVLRDDHQGDDTLRDRLQREAQAMARLSHPNVATVHEVGYSEGAVFVAMEFIRGQELEDWLADEPPWPEVLDALAQAGRGLQAAHEADLVHRDFKPQNAMRTEDGLVKVLDFGLARAAGSVLTLGSSDGLASGTSLTSTLTAVGSVMGTPAYMAPEQHRGESTDARTDQYSFCIALWRGLVGRRPFLAKTMAGLLEAKLRGAPAWPDGAPPVPKPVVEALRRGLSPDPDDRFPSMDPLLQALAQQPARRRTRWGAAALGVAIVGLGGWVWSSEVQRRAQRCTGAIEQLQGVWDQERRDQVQQAFSEHELSYAQVAWERSQRELDEYADQWAVAHTEACEASTVRGEQSAAVMDLRMSCLHRAATKLRAVVDTLADADAGVVSQSHQVTAGLYPLSRCADVEALSAGVEPPLPAEAEAVDAVRQQLAQAEASNSAGRYADAQATLDAAEEGLAGVEYGPVQTEVAYLRGITLEFEGEYEASEAALLRALELASYWHQWEDMGAASTQLIRIVGERQSKFEEGLRYVGMAKGLAADDPAAQAAIIGAVATIHMRQGKFEQFEAESRRLLELRLEELGPEHLWIGFVRARLSLALTNQKKYEAAEIEYREALRVHELQLGAEHPAITTLHMNYAVQLYLQGKYGLAEREFRSLVALNEKNLGPTHPETAKTRMNVAAALTAQERYEEAEAENRRALAAKLESLPSDHPEIASSRNNLAFVLEKQGKYEEAEAEFRAAWAIKARVLGRTNPSSLRTWSNLAKLLDFKGEHGEAEAELRDMLAATLELEGEKEGVHTASARHQLADVLMHQGRHEEALAEHRRALEVRERDLGATDEATLESALGLGRALLDLDRFADALPLLERVWTERQGEESSAKPRAEVAFALARTLWSIEPPARDRKRARTLAEGAASSYGAGTDEPAEELAEVTRWLEEHRVP